jgi:hypothetical protein
MVPSPAGFEFLRVKVINVVAGLARALAVLLLGY